MKKLFILLFLKALFIYCVFSQSNIRFEHLTVNDGLSHSKINCIFQDSAGFMWFGTEDGLNRYDGYSFTLFSSNPDDSSTLSGPSVRSIFEDNDGNLWIGSSGLNLFDKNKERFVQFRHNPNIPKSISKGEVTCIYQDNSGNYWIGTEGGGLNQFFLEKNEFIHYTHQKNNEFSLSNNNVSVIYQDGFGVLWIGTGDGLNKFDAKNKKFITYRKNQGKTNAISGNRITSIHEDQEGNLWIGTNPGGLNKYERASDRFITFLHDKHDPKTICSNRIGPVSEDANGNIIIGTNNGYSIYNQETKEFRNYFHNNYDYYSLNSNYITALFKDASGIIWLGTYTEGINKYESISNYFNNHQKIPGNQNSLSNNNVTSIVEDKEGIIWIGTKGGGLNKYDPFSETYTHIMHDAFNPRSLSFNTILSLEMKQEELWAGSIKLDIIATGNNNIDIEHFENITEGQNTIKGSAIWDILHDSKGNLWVGALKTLNKISFYDDENIEVEHFSHNPENSSSLGNGYVEVLYEDPGNKIWIGAGGLNQYNAGNPNKQFTRYQNDPGNAKSLSNNQVKTIIADEIGNLWIGTEGGGLNYFNISEVSFTHFTEKDGLPSDVIWGILKDQKQNLWLSTSKGLAKFNTETYAVKKYDVNDGIQGNIFNQGAYFKNSKNKMYFGGTNGFVSFYPDSIKNNTYIPPIVITDLKILNNPVEIKNKKDKKAILNKSIIHTKQINLHHSDHIFSIQFAALHYANPNKIQYAYKLEPIEKDWNYTGADARIATYSNLKAGKYVFLVKGTNADEVWNENPRKLLITVSPPFWFTWWAYVIYGLILVSILLVLRNFIIIRERYKNDLKVQRIESQKSHELNQLKLKFFTNVSHEFRTPLTLILGPLEKMLQNQQLNHENRELFDLMHRNASRLLRLVNQIMDFRKIESGNLKLDLTKNDIINYVKEVGNSFNNIAQIRQINYQIVTNINYQTAWFDPDKLEKIIYNLLSNAFKYTPDKGRILLSASVIENNSLYDMPGPSSSGNNIENKQIIISVEDTGMGIEKKAQEKIFDRFYNTKSKELQQEGTGIGLELTKEMVLLHHGKINVDSNPGKGSCFTIVLPLGKDHYDKKNILKAIEKIEEKKKSETQTTGKVQEPHKAGQNDNTNQLDSSILLIVEDNADVRLFLKSNLQNDYQIIEASNGQEGFEKALKVIPDIILTDIMMPVMDGLELCKKVKNEIATSHIPVIMLTARVTEHHKIEGLETGADDYITKPFNLQEIDLKLNNIIDTRKKLQEKFKSNTNGDFQFKEIVRNQPDENFLKKATEIVNQNMSNPNFDNKLFIEEIGMSRTQLYRKLKALTNQSVHEFIRTIRLKKALQLLKNGEHTISEITYEIGFSNHSYFNKCFRDYYGVSPSEYIKNNK